MCFVCFPYVKDNFFFFFSKRHRLRVDRSMLELPFPFSCSKLSDDVAFLVFAPHHVFVDHQPLQTNGATGVDPACADPHLRAEPIAEAVRKARAGIDESPRRVHRAAERGRCLVRLGYDRVGVMRGMGIDVLDGAL